MELELIGISGAWNTEDETIGFNPNSLCTTRISQGKRLFLPNKVKPVHDVWVGLVTAPDCPLVTWEEVEDGTCA